MILLTDDGGEQRQTSLDPEAPQFSQTFNSIIRPKLQKHVARLIHNLHKRYMILSMIEIRNTSSIKLGLF